MTHDKESRIVKLIAHAALVAVLSLAWQPALYAAERRPIDVIEDNSFLIEEAYNQETGVVQHTFSAAFNNDSRRRGWTFNFTQEWPLFSQDHQLSYSVPSYHAIDGADRIRGLGDIMLNYRYQASEERDSWPALAPRFSLILPTGNPDRGTGDGVVGFEWQLPASKKLGPQFALHANAGITYLPRARARVGGSTGPLSARHSLVSYHFGASGIFAVASRVHLMLEWLGEFAQSINDAGKARRDFQPVISPGFRTALVDREKVQVVAGAATPIGLNRKADNYGAFLYLSIEHDLQ
jgi:hypothetical protein